jgi:hypothetical protein
LAVLENKMQSGYFLCQFSRKLCSYSLIKFSCIIAQILVECAKVGKID